MEKEEGSHNNAVKLHAFTAVKIFPNIIRILFAQSVVSYLMGGKKLIVPIIPSSDNLDRPITRKH